MEAKAIELSILIESSLDNFKGLLGDTWTNSAILILNSIMNKNDFFIGLILIKSLFIGGLADFKGELWEIFSFDVVIKMEIDGLLNFDDSREFMCKVTSFLFKKFYCYSFVVTAHFPSFKVVAILVANSNDLAIFKDSTSKSGSIVDDGKSINFIMFKVSIDNLSTFKDDES